VRHIGGERDLSEGLLAVGARHREHPFLEGDVLSPASSRCAAIFRPLTMTLSLAFDSAARRPPASASVGSHAELHLVGIAAHDVDVVERDAELLADDLGKCGLVSWP